MSNFKLALEAPGTSITYFEQPNVDQAIEESRKSPRKRIVLPIHKNNESKVHRMFNIIQPGSYIRPHRHLKAGKTESVVLLRGGICYLTFDEIGNIKTNKNIIASSDVFGVDIEPEVIHTFFALENDTVIFEAKTGPYDPDSDKEFMEWAPEEFTQEAEQYLNDLINLTDN